jgi:hypothetical protein
VDAHLGRLRVMESATAVKAVRRSAARRRWLRRAGGDRIVVKGQPKLAPGIGFARIAKSLGMAKGSMGVPFVSPRLAMAPTATRRRLQGRGDGGFTLSELGGDLVGDTTSAFADFVSICARRLSSASSAGRIPTFAAFRFAFPLVSQTAVATATGSGGCGQAADRLRPSAGPRWSAEGANMRC